MCVGVWGVWDVEAGGAEGGVKEMASGKAKEKRGRGLSCVGRLAK